MKIAVIGTGYVGLVVAACFAENGNDVTAVDIDEDKIRRLTEGEIPIYEPGLGEIVERNVGKSRLNFTIDFDGAVRSSDIIFIAVGTPQDEDGSADLTHVLSVAEGIAKAMNGSKTVVLKSTVPVGTNRKVSECIGGLTDKPFYVVSNPEFLKEGAALDDFLKPDRVVVGTDHEKAAETMMELYRPFVRTGKPILVMDPESAEISKYAANAMLATRISFMNEMARLCEETGADVAQVRKAIGSDSRIGGAFLFPGIGYGGSCFPKDIRALLRTGEDHGTPLKIIRATEEVNEAQKTFLLPKIEKHFGGELNGRTFAIWGLAFKPRTDDMREAPSISLITALVRAGANVRVYDPEAIEESRRSLKHVEESVEYCSGGYVACRGASALILVTEWSEFREPDFARIREELVNPVIFDGRNIYNPLLLRERGFTYYGIGRR